MGWLMWLYLALDVAHRGGLSEPAEPGARYVDYRETKHRMLEYARVAQRINGNRGIPVIGEAILLHRAARAEPESKYLREQTYLSVSSRAGCRSVEYADLRALLAVPGRLRASRRTRSRRVDGGTVAIPPSGWTRCSFPGSMASCGYYAVRHRRSRRAMHCFATSFIHGWGGCGGADPDASDRYFDRLDAYAAAAGDSAFLAELKERRESAWPTSRRERSTASTP